MPYEQAGNEAGRGRVVADPAAISSVVAAGTAPTKAEYDALRTDVVNLRTALVALNAALRSSNTVD